MSSTTSDDMTTTMALPWRGTLRGWALRQIGRRLHCGTLTVITPEHARAVYRGTTSGPEATLVLHRWRTLRRLVLNGDVGFAEAYMDGDWSSPEPAALLELAARNAAPLSPAIDGTPFARLLNRVLHGLHANTLAGSRRNIRQHYDLGNAFYALWLDAGLSYSSALYSDPAMTLAQAQAAKHARVLALLDVAPGDAVLEIGCGWGSMAELLAQHDCAVTGLTLSPAQLAYARDRLAARGLSGRANLLLQDYRESSGSFDRVVSIEMLEAVGEAFWPRYFDILRARLKPGGVAVLQVITIDDARFEGYRRAPDFIQRYIFPGGMLPPPGALRRCIAEAGLALQHVETFGDSYAQTLVAWRRRFLDAWPQIAAMGFPERFRRMWDYYLGYCEGGFRAGAIDVGLWRIARPA
ncbi:MAG: cyclopropane-fatty-acyl-phospholipid synthase family protein [Acetobacteraceae bacterium]|jgi:cyclopropane-fatty-acyl-phospholipid synthase